MIVCFGHYKELNNEVHCNKKNRKKSNLVDDDYVNRIVFGSFVNGGQWHVKQIIRINTVVVLVVIITTSVSPRRFSSTLRKEQKDAKNK